MCAFFKREAFVNILIVTIPIILLISIIYPYFLNRKEKAEYLIAQKDLNMIKKSLDVFKNDIGRYPTQEEGLLHLIENIGLAGWDGPYLSRERIRDPWGEMYKYSFDVVNDLPFFIGTSGKNKRWDTNNEEALKRTVNSDDVIIWLGTKTGVNK